MKMMIMRDLLYEVINEAVESVMYKTFFQGH